MRIHFIGIGGIGISALAQYYLAQGNKVSGSDLVSSEITDLLKEKGAKILIGHKETNLSKDVDLVVYSLAVPENNPEMKKANKLKIKNKSYPRALGELTKRYFTIAVSGTHGKSTVASMIGLLLTKAGFDPTVIVGTKLREFGNSNFRQGKSKYLVIEADEHMASFLNYWPKIIVLTNIEREHLDFYKNLNNILKAFKEYILHLPKNGVLIVNKDDKNLRKLITGSPISTIVKNVLYYSLRDREAEKLKKILKIPGNYNVSNALAVLKVAQNLKIPSKIAFESLSQYRGAWRRFETYKTTFEKKPITIVSDYGHHPTEIKVTLEAAREKFGGRKKIWTIFQPHQYQRTYYLWKDFIKVFKEAPMDKLIITDIYDVIGRENKKIKEKINSEKLVKEINKPKIIYLAKRKILKYLKGNLQGREVIIIMGAGDIYKLVDYFLQGS